MFENFDTFDFHTDTEFLNFIKLNKSRETCIDVCSKTKFCESRRLKYLTIIYFLIDYFELSNHTCALSILYIDILEINEAIEEEYFDSIICSSVFLAAKMSDEKRKIVSFHEIQKRGILNIRVEHILEFEKQLFAALSFYVMRPTVHTFGDAYLTKVFLEEDVNANLDIIEYFNGFDKTLELMKEEYTILCLISTLIPNLCQFKPSLIAAGIIFCIRVVFGFKTVWPSYLEFYTTYSEKELQESGITEQILSFYKAYESDNDAPDYTHIPLITFTNLERSKNIVIGKSNLEIIKQHKKDLEQIEVENEMKMIQNYQIFTLMVEEYKKSLLPAITTPQLSPSDRFAYFASSDSQENMDASVQFKRFVPHRHNNSNISDDLTNEPMQIDSNKVSIENSILDTSSENCKLTIIESTPNEIKETIIEFPHNEIDLKNSSNNDCVYRVLNFSKYKSNLPNTINENPYDFSFMNPQPSTCESFHSPCSSTHFTQNNDFSSNTLKFSINSILGKI